MSPTFALKKKTIAASITRILIDFYRTKSSLALINCGAEHASLIVRASSFIETHFKLENFEMMKRNRKSLQRNFALHDLEETKRCESSLRWFNDEFMLRVWWCVTEARWNSILLFKANFVYAFKFFWDFPLFSLAFLCWIHRDNIMNRDVNILNTFAFSWL